MSPTSYQTAPPRISIINNAFDIVKPGGRDFGLARRIHGLVLSIEGAEGLRARIEDSEAVEENTIYGQERSERQSNHPRARTLERAASSSPKCCRNSRVRHRFPFVASRVGGAGSPGNDGTTQPVAGRYHDIARSLQEIALASRGANVLSAAPLV